MKIELTEEELLIINNFCYEELKSLKNKDFNLLNIDKSDIEDYKNKLNKLMNKTNLT